MNMLIAEYDYEEDIRANREEAREEAIEKHSRLILRLTGEGKNDMIIQTGEDNALRERLYQEYHL